MFINQTSYSGEIMKELFNALNKKLILRIFATVLAGVIFGTVAFNITMGEDSTEIEKRVNLLIVGNDTYSQTSDAVFILSVDPLEQIINLIPIPASSLVSLNGTKTALANIYRAGGIQILIDKVTEIVPVPIDYYAAMDFQAFRHIVDSVGGVDIDVPFDMNYYDSKVNYKINLQKGHQHLDGKKAEMFIRYVPGNNEQNLTRETNQKTFFKEFITQKLDSDIIRKFPDVFPKTLPYITSDITISDAGRFLNILKSLQSCEINHISLSGVYKIMDNTRYFVPDYESNKNILK